MGVPAEILMPAGETLVLVDPSGSGKRPRGWSTVISLPGMQ